MISDPAFDAAQEIVGGRLRVRPVSDSTRERYSEASVATLIDDLKKATDFRQRDALGLLLAERKLEEAIETRSKKDLDAAVFRLAQHYKTVAMARKADDSSRACASEAAELLFGSLLNPSQDALKQLREGRTFYSGSVPSWSSTTGLDSDTFGSHVDQLVNALRQTTTSGRGSDGHYLRMACAENDLSWVSLGLPGHADLLMLAQSPWQDTGGSSDLEAGDTEIARAVVLAIEDRSYLAARRLAHELGRRIKYSWAPSQTFEQMQTWNALRAAVHLGAMEESTASVQRLNALSAYELLAGLPLPQAREDALESSYQGLRPANGDAGKEWAAAYARLISVGDEQDVVESLTNSDRATLRDQLGDEKNMHDLARSLQFRRNELKTELRTSYSDKILEKWQRRHAKWRNVLLPPEIALVDRVNEPLEEIYRLVRTDASAERTAALIAARSELVTTIEEVSTSSSMVVQEFALPALQLLLKEIDSAKGQAQRASRPELSITLQTDRLPLRSESEKEFTAILEVNNKGNTSALNVEIGASSTKAEVLTTPPVITQLRSGQYESESINLRRSAALDQLTLLVSANWTDEMGQSFEEEFELVAEAETESQWKNEDVNPYGLDVVRRREDLFGRNSEIKSLTARLSAGESLFVTGKKRVGKSSLVGVTLEGLGELGKATGLSKYGYLQADSVGQLISELLLTIEVHLFDEYGDIVPDLPAHEPESASNVGGRWVQRIKLPPGAGLVLAIDDFDELPDQFWESDSGSKLFVFLRALVGEPWLSIVFIGSEVMPSLMARHGHKLNQVGRFDLSALERVSDTALLLRTPSKGRLEWDEDAVRLVHIKTAGNPYYATLLAREIWDRMRERDRSFVAPTDVADCLSYLAETTEADHFVHLWADGARGLDIEFESSTQNAVILFAISQCAGTGESAGREEVIAFALARSTPDDRPALEEQLESLIARKIVIETSDDSLRHEIPFVEEWFRKSAIRVLGSQLRALKEAATEDAFISEGKLLELSKDFRFNGGLISEIRIRDWLDQFTDRGARVLAFNMLERLKKDYYFSNETVETTGVNLRKWFADPKLLNHKVPVKAYTKKISLVCPMEHDVQLAKMVAKGANIPQRDVLTLTEALDELSSGKDWQTMVVTTSFDGTGSEANDAALQLSEFPDVSVGLFSIASLNHETSVSAGGNGRWPRHVSRPLSASAKPFDPEDGCFSAGSDENQLRKTFREVGKKLSKDDPLGWPSNGLLLMFETYLPKYMPPVFWGKGQHFGKEWRPLLSGSPEWAGAMPPEEEGEMIRMLIAKGENEEIEFKASLSTDYPGGERNKERHFDVSRAVAGLINGEGGSLLIGVDDQRQVVGLEADYNSSQNIADRDGFERHLRQILRAAIGLLMPTDINVRFAEIDGHDVCHVKCERVTEAKWHKKGAEEILFVRDGGGALPYSGPKLEKYLRQRFPD